MKQFTDDFFKESELGEKYIRLRPPDFSSSSLPSTSIFFAFFNFLVLSNSLHSLNITMQFSNVLALAAVATASYVNSTSYATENDVQTTVVTITSCHDNACSEVPVTTGLTVVTTTIDSTVTEYTTYCPLTTTEAPASSSVPSLPVNSTSHEISTFPGAAAKAVPAVAAIAAGVALLF
ncbi:hypothetical protein WICPIJ_002622 [Wickerhamomyces pijperi]|uniref:Uncharacterized protein n=1 Tax=Wickerhamomyces pijperi TaxID=599730 RepID=A0A9P8QBF0_WICPI|nr:hypothetical protein WICPIJ_002622 [Wickerhamomyces pijperi]